MNKLIASIIIAATIFTAGCAGKTAPILTPTKAARVVAALGIVQATADAMYAQSFISQKADTTIHTAVTTADATINAAPSGWATTVEATLASIDSQLSADEQTKLSPYIAIVNLILTDVIN